MWPLPSWQLHTNYVTFPPRQYQLGWMISNILSIIHVCGQANSPFTTSVQWKCDLISQLWHTSVTPNHIFQVSTCSIISWQHMDVKYISIFQTPHNLNLHSTTLLFVANAHSDESQVSTLLLRTKVYPCFVWVMAPWYCLLLYYIISFQKKHLLNRHSWTQTTNLMAQ